MRTIRTLLLLALFACLSHTASAQFQFGAGAVLGLDFNEFGVQARGQYGFTETWRGAADFTLYFPGENVSAFEFNANAHYVLLDQGPDALRVYALGGLNVIRFSVDDDLGIGQAFGLDLSYTDVGLNLGGGVNIPLGGLTGYAELKYAAGGSQLGLTAGVLFGN